MTTWDTHRRIDEVRELRHALAQARQYAEQALVERDAAVAALNEAEAEPDPRVAVLAADLANVRRNRDEAIARARAEERASGVAALASVYDDLIRSVSANPDRTSAWFVGHQAIVARVRQAIRAGGASELGRVGDTFDPTVHEAIGTAPGPAGTVVAVDRVGFRLDDGTLVRPAQVRVAA